MKVHIVERADYDNSFVVGVYTSPENALAAALRDRAASSSVDHEFSIEEYEVDQGPPPPEGLFAFCVLLDKYKNAHRTSKTVPPESGHYPIWVFAADWASACLLAVKNLETRYHKEKR